LETVKPKKEETAVHKLQAIVFFFL